jgi:hypothetical protein
MTQSTLAPKTRVVHVRDNYDVYIGRPSRYGNQFYTGTKAENIAAYEAWLMSQPELLAKFKSELTGKVLGCYCKPESCHGDILVRLCDG